MGGGSKGSGMRPEINVPLAPSPGVGPVQQPEKPMQQNYSQYYLPQNIDALRQSLMSQNGEMPFGVRSSYKTIAPNSKYAAPRPTPIFRAPNLPPVQPIQQNNQINSQIENRLAQLEMENARLREQYMNNQQGNSN